MAKPFAEAFYGSKAWRRCRDAYVADRVLVDGGMCESCREKAGEELHHIRELTVANIGDPEVTLNHDNLAWLCRDCHFKAHRELIARSLRRKRAGSLVNEAGYYFDENGEIRQAKVYIVYGSPASGKTSYVRKHRREGDLVVDLDLIKQAISMQGGKDAPDNLLEVALAMREAAYGMIESRVADCRTSWVVASLPERAERLALAERLGAELVYIDATYGECIKRAMADPERRDVVGQLYLIDRWWERFQA